jgi:hypothetical protein
MLEEIQQIEVAALAELTAASAPDTLESWRQAYLGPKGKLKGLMPRLKGRPARRQARRRPALERAEDHA